MNKMVVHRYYHGFGFRHVNDAQMWFTDHVSCFAEFK